MLQTLQSYISFSFILGACVGMMALTFFEQPAFASQTIRLEKSVYFVSSNDEPIVVKSGMYKVEAADASLKLTPTMGSRSDAVLIQATRGTHDDEVAAPQVLFTASKGQPDLRQLVLLLPDGTGLEALGSTTRIWPRGKRWLFRVKAFEQSRLSTGTHAFVPPHMPASRKICTQTKIDDEVRGASPAKVKIDCHLNLTKADTIKKVLVFEGSDATGVTLNCNGATIGVGENKDMIEVKSLYIEKTGKWDRPENVTIKNCNVIGSVRVWGMGKNGEASPVKESSKKEKTKPSNHKNRLRNNAPKNIVFHNVTITGLGRNPFYLAPGVTYSKLLHSEMKGKSTKVAIYLDAESAHNIIKDNFIHVATGKDKTGDRIPGMKSRGWPLIAIDGSSRNHILNNIFSGLNRGGIYLYRNCGEGGTIRHATPSRNSILNNIFFYKKYKGGKPAVFLGSRDYGFKERLGHCDDDDGRPYGSSASETDYARHNVVMQNQFYKRQVIKQVGFVSRFTDATISDYVKTRNTKANSPNYIDHNQVVTENTAVNVGSGKWAKRLPWLRDSGFPRLAGCYLAQPQKRFLLHGRSLDLLEDSPNRVCVTQSSCSDGESSGSRTSDCRVQKVEFNCQVSGSNKGCQKTVRCPSGKKLLGAKAACNLEFGTVSNSVLQPILPNIIKVLTASDKVSAGSCKVGGNELKKGQKEIIINKSSPIVAVGCREHDKNGGDCHIKGNLYCR